MLKNDNGQAAADFYDRRRKWAEYLSTHPNISDRAFRVGYWLSRRMNGDDQCCWYSVARIVSLFDLPVHIVGLKKVVALKL